MVLSLGVINAQPTDSITLYSAVCLLHFISLLTFYLSENLLSVIHFNDIPLLVSSRITGMLCTHKETNYNCMRWICVKRVQGWFFIVPRHYTCKAIQEWKYTQVIPLSPWEPRCMQPDSFWGELQYPAFDVEKTEFIFT